MWLLWIVLGVVFFVGSMLADRGDRRASRAARLTASSHHGGIAGGYVGGISGGYVGGDSGGFGGGCDGGGGGC